MTEHLETRNTTEADEEIEYLSEIVQRQAKLLTDTVNLLRGLPPDDTLWSHHDIPELVAKLMAERDDARACK